MLFFFWISGFLVVSKNAKFSGFLVDRATTFGGFTKIKLATLVWVSLVSLNFNVQTK